MQLIIGAFVGAIIALMLRLLFEQSLNRVKARVFRFFKRKFSTSKYPIISAEVFAFGSISTTWIVLDGDGEHRYAPENIKCYYDPQGRPLPPMLAGLRAEVERREQQNRESGRQSHWDGWRYGLQNYKRSRTAFDEDLLLHLWFGPSDYYTFLAVNMNLDSTLLGTSGKETTLRREYLEQADWGQPAMFFSNSFGVDLALVTSDEYLVVTQRSKSVGSRPGAFSISINEGLSLNGS